MQNAAFRALGLDWRYVKLPVPPRALRRDRARAARLGLPRRQRDDPAQGRRAGAGRRGAATAARAIGAANTLTFAPAARSRPTTPTRRGFLAALGERPAAGRRALVLGAGGAGARPCGRCARPGRPRCRSGTAPRSVPPRWPRSSGVTHAERPGPCDLLVNATSVGLEPRLEGAEALQALGLDGLEPPPVVVDLVYSDGPHRPARLGRRRGLERRWTASRSWCAREPSASSSGRAARPRSRR